MCKECPVCTKRSNKNLFDGNPHCGHCLGAMKFSYPEEKLTDKRYTVYRHYENSGRLLYVGITNSGTRRMNEHAAHSDWFQLTDYSTYKHYDTRKDALDAEWVAIRDENPVFNTVRRPPTHWKPGQTEPPPEYTLDYTKLFRIT